MGGPGPLFEHAFLNGLGTQNRSYLDPRRLGLIGLFDGVFDLRAHRVQLAAKPIEGSPEPWHTPATDPLCAVPDPHRIRTLEARSLLSNDVRVFFGKQQLRVRQP